MTLKEYFKAKKLLDKYGINSIESKYVSSADEAVRFAEQGKIVLKLISENALHKTKAGLVHLDLQGEEIRNAFVDLEAKGKELAPYQIIAQRMSVSGVEIIIGGREDAQFGKMVLLGLGGIYVETFKDFALRVCPISKYDAASMVEQLKSTDVVTYKGEAKDMLVDLVLKAGKLMEKEKIKELDLNPVIIREDGYDVVDIRILE